jgi:hypothetical protein
MLPRRLHLGRAVLRRRPDIWAGLSPSWFLGVLAVYVKGSGRASKQTFQPPRRSLNSRHGRRPLENSRAVICRIPIRKTEDGLPRFNLDKKFSRIKTGALSQNHIYRN